MKIDVVSYSESFVKRTVCRYCKTGPIARFVSFECFCVKDYKSLKDVIYKYYNTYNTLNPDFIYLVNPRDDLDIGSYCFVPPFPVNVRLHKNMKYPTDVNNAFEKIDIATCECSRTSWFFNMSYPEKIGKVDVLCRKSHKKFRIDF